MTAESLNMLSQWLSANPVVLALLLIWTLVWKGVALWQAAGLRQKYWFLAILILNTVGILEIIYIYFVARKYTLEVVEK